jgi:hypothetical protein
MQLSNNTRNFHLELISKVNTIHVFIAFTTIILINGFVKRIEQYEIIFTLICMGFYLLIMNTASTITMYRKMKNKRREQRI